MAICLNIARSIHLCILSVCGYQCSFLVNKISAQVLNKFGETFLEGCNPNDQLIRFLVEIWIMIMKYFMNLSPARFQHQACYSRKVVRKFYA